MADAPTSTIVFLTGADPALLEKVVAEARACRVCAGDLPHQPRPVLRASVTARLLIIGQAPGTKVHETGIPWNDRSGETLRGWMGVTRAQFYDQTRIAIISTGLCYPGRDEKGGDLPPRPECAPLWHPRLVPLLTRVELTLVVGGHAQKYVLAARARKTVAETVRAWRGYGPEYLPLPHPSWRSLGWRRRRPWFEAEVLPQLRLRVKALLEGD